MDYENDYVRFFLHAHAESHFEMEPEFAHDLEPDQELETEWESFEEAAADVLALCGQLNFEKLSEEHDTWPADVYMTITESGVSIDDGNWAEYDCGVFFPALVEKLKTALAPFADFTGGGSLPDAMTACISQQLSPCIAAVQVLTDEAHETLIAHDGHATLRVDVNEEGTQPQQAALGWVNSASLQLNPDQDAVTFALSTGDPRGAFVFTARRLDTGEIVLELPHPSDSLLHEGLTPRGEGFYTLTRTLPN